MSEKKEVISLVIVMVVVLGAVLLLPQRMIIPRGEAIAKVTDYFKDTPLTVEKTVLRPPTEEEENLIKALGSEPPNLIWMVEATLVSPGWDQYAKVMLNAYTGEILSIVILV